MKYRCGWFLFCLVRVPIAAGDCVVCSCCCCCLEAKLPTCPLPLGLRRSLESLGVSFNSKFSIQNDFIKKNLLAEKRFCWFLFSGLQTSPPCFQNPTPLQPVFTSPTPPIASLDLSCPSRAGDKSLLFVKYTRVSQFEGRMLCLSACRCWLEVMLWNITGVRVWRSIICLCK